MFRIIFHIFSCLVDFKYFCSDQPLLCVCLMAGGGFTSNGGTNEYPGKMTAYVIFACVIAASGGLIFGYDIGISGKNLIYERGYLFFFN